MTKKIKDLKHEVKLTDEFDGTYKWKGGTSYYLNGNSSSGEIHFSINGGNNDDFKGFHITRSIGGLNAQVFFTGATMQVHSGSPKLNNVPTAEKLLWNTWWTANKDKVKKAGAEFWKKVQE